LPGQLIPDHDQLLGLGKGQRPQQDGIDDTENSRVRTDAQGELKHGHGGEAGLFQELAEGEFEVVHCG
jgi:hypothetical protein